MKSLIKLTLLVVALLIVGAITGLIPLSSSDKASKNFLIIKGSDTMVHLCSKLAEEYMKKNNNTSISVTGGGSGTGIAALLNGTTDLCASSRKIKDKEITASQKKGIKTIETPISLDGIAVVIHPSNSVKELSLSELKRIYTGEYSNWSQLGGEDRPITVLSRESSSGTYVFFQKRVLNKRDYSPKARLMPATSSIIQAISDDEGAIGYVGLGYATKAKDKVKMVAIKEKPESKGVLPSVQTIQSGQYPIARPLHFYSSTKNEVLVQEFIAYALSEKGQQIVEETGYVKVR